MTTQRAPAVPLIVHDPFFSIWSTTDELTQSWPSHWTGRPQALCGLIRIDGTCYRFMGQNTKTSPTLPALRQESCNILPTRTIYRFSGGGVGLTLTFTTPALPHLVDVLARPATYVTCDVETGDGSAHDVQLYLDISATICTDKTEAAIVWGRHRYGVVQSVWCGPEAQDVLGRSGDECFTDWGYLHLSPDPQDTVTSGIGDAASLRKAFANTGIMPDIDGYDAGDGISMPAPASGGEGRSNQGHGQNRNPLMVLGLSKNLGACKTGVLRMVVAYDHVKQIQYFERDLPPLWRNEDQTAIAMISRAWDQREELEKQCRDYDNELTADMEKVAGKRFARLGTLAFRQCLGGHALVADKDGTLLHFSKENSSNGCLGTVDLTYPAAPFFLLFNPALLAAQMRFIFDYAASEHWPFPFAPHDIGRYPLANGQVYGGGAESEADQMPFEECGNMLILAAALTQVTGDPETLRKDWPLLEKWADYLIAQGFDPNEQLCTDDFDGHMAHNVNLSAKGILALGAAAQLADKLGVDGKNYLAAARNGAAAWIASEKDDAHYRMCFDQPQSWSLKYNLIWDRFLGLRLFDTALFKDEVEKYKAELRPFGVPLHSRADYTKLDWMVWAACLSGEDADRDAIFERIDAWLDAAPDRVPLADWFETETGLKARGHGFRARPVVGGVFVPMMLDHHLLKKWSIQK